MVWGQRGVEKDYGERLDYGENGPDSATVSLLWNKLKNWMIFWQKVSNVKEDVGNI